MIRQPSLTSAAPQRDPMSGEVLITEYCLLITIQSLVDSGYLRFSLESIVLP